MGLNKINPDRSVGVEGGRKSCDVVLVATERKCCDCSQLPQRAQMQIEYVHIGVRRRQRRVGWVDFMAICDLLH